MVANVDPVFGEIGVLGMVTIDTANANRDGTGAMGTLVTAGADGTLVDFIICKAIVATSAAATIIRLFIDDGGGNIFLWDEKIYTAFNPATGVQSSEVRFDCFLALPSGYMIKMSIADSKAFRCFAHGADL